MTEKIAQMIEDFPFDQVAEKMKEAKWKWIEIGYPTEARLRERAIWLYRSMKSGNLSNIWSGGIGFEVVQVVNGPSKVTMRFGKSKDIWFERYEYD